MKKVSRRLSTSKHHGEAEDFDGLRRLGFSFGGSGDRLSFQPDSSGRIGGRRGAQEYGIVGNLASEDVLDRLSSGSPGDTEDALRTVEHIAPGTLDVETEAELQARSMRESLEIQARLRPEAQDSALENEISILLAKTGIVDPKSITISATAGQVIIEGEIDRQDQKTATRRLLSKLGGIKVLVDKLSPRKH